MLKLGTFETFVTAVQTGSFSAAARKRHTSQPAVSQQIATLEAHCGVRLLNRDRNGVRLTEAGAVVYKHAQKILGEHKKLHRELEALSGKVAGKITVTASLGLSQYVMADVIIELAKQYPDLTVRLRAEDQILDLDQEQIDLALRFGQLGDSSGFARKIATLDLSFVATPAYLDEMGRPKTPADLSRLDYIQYRGNDEQIVMQVSKASKKENVPINVGLTAQLPDLIFQALHSNLGFATLPGFLVDEDIRNGRLEIVLPEWQIPPAELFLVYPHRETHSARVIAFLTVLFDQLSTTKGANLLASARQMLER